jgi:hypothetical protein
VPNLQDGDRDNVLPGWGYGTSHEKLIDEYGAMCGMVVNGEKSKKVEEIAPES